MATYPEEQGVPISMMDQVGPGQPMPMPMMPAPPAPSVSPGLAAASGVQSALAGRGGNPYLSGQQQQANTDSAQTMQMMGMQQQQFAQQQAQQMQMMQLQQKAKEMKDRKETADRELAIKVNQSLLESNNPDANKVGAAGMSQWSKTLGIDAAPEHFIQAKNLPEKDQEHVNLMITAGIPVEEIQARYPRATPQWIATQAKVLANPTAAKVMGVTAVDPALEAQKREGERTTAWLAEHQEFGGKDKPDLFFLAGKYYRAATGREMTTAKAGDLALEAARERADKEIEDNKVKLEQAKRAQVLADRAAEKIQAGLDKPAQVASGGGLWQKSTKTMLPPGAATIGDVRANPKDFTNLNATQKTLVDFLDTVPPQIDMLDKLTGDLLAAAGPGANLGQAANLFLQGKLAMNPKLTAFYAMNTDVALEAARALSGGGQLRVTVLKAIEKDLLPKPEDSIQTAVAKLKTVRRTFENRRAGILGEEVKPFLIPGRDYDKTGKATSGAEAPGLIPGAKRIRMWDPAGNRWREGTLPPGADMPEGAEVVK